MAPGVRSGRRAGHPEVSAAAAAVLGAGGEDAGGRFGAGGQGRCLRTRWRAGAAGMFGNCVLSVGMLLLVVRCAVAAEEKPTYDASGSSSLPSDHVVTAASAHPLADLSVAEEVPFSVVHPDGGSESEVEGLSGRPAFSSVLTVMAGTVKHPVSLDQSRTLPTITRDDTHTTQWPSHSSSQGSEMSSFSSSSARERTLLASSGLTSSMFHQHTTPTQVSTMASGVSRPSHMSSIRGNMNISSSPSSLVSSFSLLSSIPPSSQSTSVLPSVLSLFLTSDGWIKHAASSQDESPTHQRDTATLSLAGSVGWTDSLRPTESTTYSLVDLPAVTKELQSTTPKPLYSQSETSNDISNKGTKHSFLSSAAIMHGVGEGYKWSASTKVGKTPATTNAYTSHADPDHGQNPLNILDGPTQTWTPSMNSVSATNLDISTSYPLHSESQAVQMQQGASQNPRSPLLSVIPESFSAASQVTEQMLNLTAYAKNDKKMGVDSQNNVEEAIITAPGSYDVNPTETPETPAVTFKTPELFFSIPSQSLLGETSFSETAITKLTHIPSGTLSSVHASNPGDLPMAAGHSSPRGPAINMNYSSRGVAGAELKSIFTQIHLTNSLSPTQTKPGSTSGSIIELITRTGTTSSTSESDPSDLPSNGGINVKDFVAGTGSPMGMTQQPGGWTMPSIIFSPKSKKITVSGSAIPGGFAKDMYLKPMSTNLTPTQPTYSLPLAISDSPKHNKPDDNTGLSDQPKGLLLSAITPSQRPFQTRSLLSFPHRLYPTSGGTSGPNKSQQTAEISAHIEESPKAGSSKASTLELDISAGNIKTSPAYNVLLTEKGMPAVSFEINTTKSSVSSSLNGNEEPTLIRHTTFYNKNAPLVRLTTQFSSFNTAKDSFMFNKRSEVSFKGSPIEIPFSTLALDATLEPLTTLSREDDMTRINHYERLSPSSWSDIIQTPRTNSVSHSQGPITSVGDNKSDFHLSKHTVISSTAPSAKTTSYSDRQNSRETFGAIFSFGTKQMAPYTKWKATKSVPFQSTAVELETTSIGFDRAHTSAQADGLWYEHPKLEERPERNEHVLTSADSADVVTDPYSFYPTFGEHTSFGYTKKPSGFEETSLNLSPANLRSALAVNIEEGVSASDDSLAFFHTTGIVPSSQEPSLTLVYKNQHSPSLADVHSAGSAFDTVATPSNSLGHSISDTDSIEHTSDSKLTELVPSSSEAWPSSNSSIKAAQLTSLQISASSSSLPSSLSLHPTLYPATTSSAVSIKAAPDTFPFSSPSLTLSVDPNPSGEMTQTFVVLTEAGTDDLTAGTSRAVALTFPKEKVSSLAPSQSVRIPLSAGPTERTSQVSPLPPRQDPITTSAEVTTTTVASTTKTKEPTTTMPSLGITTQSTTTTTPQPTPVTRRASTTTTIRTQTSRRIFTPPVPRTSPPRTATTVFVSPFTTTTEAPPQQCNITERLWVKTVVSIYVRRNRLDSIQRQNLRRGLSQGLRKALNDSSAQAQVETVFGSPNMTVAYHVTGGDMVYVPSVVLEGLDLYGRDKLIADLRQYLPMVTALPLPVTLWRSIPARGFQLKTVLQFVGVGDDPRSCRFSQMMEQRLEKVFSEAQVKVLNVNSRLSVQMLSVSQAAGSPTVSLVYTVKNGTVFLNGTTASNLLGQLSAELVGYFLLYPPLIIAEPLEYHNLNTSVATRDFWVITVIQDVDNASLEGQYQSFASLMEQRLAELFVLAGQQGTRFRRATAVDSYTVQMVSIRRVSGIKNPAEMTYYVQHNGIPLSGTSAAKVLNTVDSQTMALTLGYFVQLQAEPVVKNPPNNLWILAAVLAPIAVVTLIIIIITAVLCRKNKNDFKADAIGNLNPRAKMAYRRDVGYYHQPVQGFDYAKQHLGQQGGDEETLPASQDTLVMSLQIRDTPLSLEKALQQDGTASKKSLTSDKHKSKLPSEDGSVISNESEKLNSDRALTVLKVTAQQKLTKEETRKRDDPYDTSSGSLQLISIKPMAAQPNYSHPASSDRSHESAVVNGEVNLALKQKSDIEHYRNKLRLKAKRKGYYDFPSTDGSSSGRALAQRQRHSHERAAGEHGRPLEPDDERGSTFVKSHRRHTQVGQTAYRSRQSLSSPSPGGTEMDLLVMRERPRRGIRNSGYDTEPELIEETNVDRLMGPRGYMYGRGLKGHSETSTLSSQPSIDEVRQQMHLLLEEAFSLASGGQSTSGRHSHHHHPPPDHYSPGPPPLPYADVVTSAPGTMTSGRGGLQWVPSYGSDVYQCSLPKPAFHFTQLPEMAMGSPPPLPPRTGPPPGTSLRRSTSDLGPKGRSSETSVTEMQSQHDNNPYGPTTRAALPSITAEQPVSKYSGNPITAVYAIPASRPGYSEYFVSTPPTSYHSPSWMSYPPEPEDVPPQWADSLPLPGYVEAFPHPRYPQGSPTRLPLEYSPALEPPPAAPSTASKQSLPQVAKDMDSMPLSSLSTSALVQAIRQEVAKLAKKQNDMFEF